MVAVSALVSSEEIWAGAALRSVAEPLGSRRLVTIAVRQLQPGTRCDMQAGDGKLLVVVPLAGAAGLRGCAGVDGLGAGRAVMVGQAASFELVAAAACTVLLLEIDRGAIQVAAYRRTRVPRRIGRANFIFDCADAESPFVQALTLDSAATVFRFRGTDRTQAVVEEAVIAAIVGEFLARERVEGVFPVAGSVQRALDRLAEIGALPVTLDDVLRAAGVIHLTVRRAVKEIAGVSLEQLLQDARLDWVRTRLGSERENRSLGELAEALDWRPATFARAYQRRFGETPSQTRARAFRSVR